MAKKKTPPKKLSGKSRLTAKAKKSEQSTTKSQTKQKARQSSGEPGDRLPIVGIGASAGGLKALRAVFEALPERPGVALVVIQHLDPTKKSLAPELLAKYAKMQVTQVEDEPQIKPNHVYVIPPNKYLSISGDELRLSEPDQPRGARMAIDFFLRSLAKERHHCAVGVVLSGTGTDGTLGVKAAGGLVIAEDRNTADHDGMPRSAINAGVVDHVLPPEKISDVIVHYAQHPYLRETTMGLPVEAEDPHQGEPSEPPPDGLKGVIALLRSHGKHDFRDYKENTLIRRTRRRMCLHHLEDYGQYFEFLRDHPQEIDALIKDLLISVTDFFRDQHAWEQLAELVVRPVVEAKDVDDAVRVWVPGCATGEEPYSVAMLFLEELHRQEKQCPLNVFASDIDKRALDYARAGRYPRATQADVTPQRLKRFFVQQQDDPNHYHVSKALREAVVFAEQNLIADPPFSKVDLICCRNLLIYLKPEMQDKVLRLFHFALREDGFLFLGTSETVGRRDDLFTAVSRELRIFRRKGPTRHDIVEIPLAAGRRREIEPPERPREQHQSRLVHLTQQRLLDLLAPTAVVVNRDRQVLHICGEVDPYLKLAPGSPTSDVLELARHGLRTRLRGAIHKVFNEGEPAVVAARVKREGVYHPVRIEARRLQDPDHDERLALVVFEDDTSTQRKQVSSDDEQADDTSTNRQRVSSGAADVETAELDETYSLARRARMEESHGDDPDDHAVIRQLEDELAATKQDLQTTVEQYETSNEEFKAANEEVMSINEELQSTNEELETSKEELQSLNEELSTVNNQLASKVTELEVKHDDLANLLQVSNLATICLDNRLHIRWFSQQAAELIRVTSADVGRPISDFAHEFLDGDIDEVAQQVLDRLTAEEREVEARQDRWFLRRTTPYRTLDDRIGGVVITFIDITERKRSELALQSAKELSEKIIDTVREATLVLSADLRVVQANESFYRRFPVGHHETEGRMVYELGNNQWDIPELRRLLENVLPENKTFSDFEVEHEFESIGRRVMLLNGRQIDHIQMILLAIEDITELRLAERRRGFLLELSDTFCTVGDPQAILEEATTRLCGFLNCNRALFIKLDGSRSRGASILSQCNAGVDDLGVEFPLAELGSDVLAPLDRNEDLVVDDVFQDSRFKGSAPNVLTEMNVRSLVAVPQMDDNHVELLLLISRPLRRQWNREEVALIRDVSERTWSATQTAYAQRALRDSEQRLRELNDSLEQQVSHRTEMLKLLQHITRIANEARTVEEAVLAAMEQISHFNGWQVGHVWRLADDGSGEMVASNMWYISEAAAQAVGRLEEFQQICARHRFRSGEDIVGAVMTSGEPQWVNDVKHEDEWRRGSAEHFGLHAAIAFPVTVNGEVVAVIEFFSDHPAKRDKRFMEIMPDVGIQLGHVIERKRLEKMAAEATDLEQRRIGSDIHDGVGQELTGLRYMAQTHAETLAEQSSPEVKTAQRMAQWLESVQQQLRGIVRKLVPVEIDEHGLVAALRGLAEQTTQTHQVVCSLECAQPIRVAAPLATHIYRIAQEAVGNAVRHAEAGEIRITLTEDAGVLKLQIEDDGVGIKPTTNQEAGFGLRSMAYRAGLIGAQFDCQPREEGGTRVTCTVLRGGG